MVFSSVTFLFFFLPAFLLCYAILPYRNATLIVFSVIFYVWGEGVFFLVLAFSVAINYYASRVMLSVKSGYRRLALACGISVNILLLGYFKYFGFLIIDVLRIPQFNPDLVPHLPLGISFFTFQSISYLVDVYRGTAPPARRLWDLALYIMMFPQLVAGPIVRYATVARQIRRRAVHYNYVFHGLLFFAIGLAQKVLIANNVAGIPDTVFSLSIDSLSTQLAWIGATAYTIQIYFDFAGYSNMAIGLGLMMGFKFPHNFNYPYISQSITEFWRRWHMSLSSWFRDYVYIPLGGNRRGPWRTFFNLLAVFLLCGLWHGASWTFVVWGIYHGALLILERIGLRRLLDAGPIVARHFYTLLAVIIGWVIFRSDGFGQASGFLARMAFIDAPVSAVGIWEYVTHQQLFFVFIGIIASTPLARFLVTRVVSDRRSHSLGRSTITIGRQSLIDIGFAIGLMALSAIYIVSGSYNPFIYFRF